MEQQSLKPAPETVRTPEASPSQKKVYESPALQDWGSITDLTQGIKLGFEDFPISGGTRVA